ncbi:DUF1254 domain-containing protein [Paraburkholderia sp. J12]|uniref:DUF1254 domain-containing protein n=1 Tax=Paraburkholderia sp. J12 TaxID=2805432 RepID=UPI002ABD9B4E|nr:DUF1254 domain-containing protein [Paraburkholderia sp. J12]
MSSLSIVTRTASDDLFDIALEAVQFTLPLYEMARMRAATCPRRDRAGRAAGTTPESTQRWANHWVHARKLLGPADRQVVTPNNDTLYSSAWLDLGAGPLVIRVPDMGTRYYVLGLLDMYTNPFGYIGTRVTGNARGEFLLHGPRWQGEVPEGVHVVRCPTDTVWLIGRLLVEGADDVAAVNALQDQLEFVSPPGSGAQVPNLVDAGIEPHEKVGDPLRYASVVNRVLAEAPPPSEASAALARFAACGIGPGLPGERLSVAQQAALARAIDEVTRALSRALPSELGGGWCLPVELHESFGTDYVARAQVALSYIGALGIEEAMYVMADRDADGALLDGEAQYVLRFVPGGAPQVDAFWSLTAYEKASCMLAENAIGRYSIGDRTQGLCYDADGGLRIAISAREPDDATLRRNWLPAPQGQFYLALRLYMPRAAHLSRTFAYPPIERRIA